MKIKLPISKLIFRLLIIVNLFFVNAVFSQSLGDYKSNVNTTGIWANASSWLYYNGSDWEPATNYPGQSSTTTGAVLIQSGDIITISVPGISTDVMGTLTISGSLVLTGDQTVGGINFSFNTLSIIVTPTTGTIDFNDKVNLILPANATIQVTSQDNPNPTPDYKGLDGDCSAQQTIVIGTLDYAVCQGNTADTGLTFDDLMDTGGTLNATASSNSPVCEGSAINLTGGISNVGWTVISYTWEIIGPNGTTTTTITTSSTSTSTSVASALTAPGSPDYTVKLTVIAKYKSSANVTNTQTIYVVVNDRPTAPTISGTNTFCASTLPTVASLTATGTAVQWYAAANGGSALPTTTALVNGTHYYATQTVNGCESLSRLDVVATLTAPAAPTGTATQSFCLSASPTIASLAATGTAIQWYAAASGGTALATTMALVNGSHYFATQTVSGCESMSRFDVTATVNTIPAIPGLNNVTLDCTFATATWTAVPGVSNYLFDVSSDSFATFVSQNQFVAPSATSLNISGLNHNLTYYVRARAENSCGISSYSTPVTISLAVTKSSDGGQNWDNGSPDTKKAVFTGDATITNQVNACSCQIDPGVDIVFGVPGGANSNAILKLEYGLNVAATGSLTFENNASLIQVNDGGVNSGVITYKRNSTPMKDFDFTRWSSPVAGQMLNALSPNTLRDKYYSFSGGNWVTIFDGNGTMLPGVGYSIRVPRPQFWPVPTASTYVYPAQFVGVPNNGVVPVTTQGPSQFNLIGNPYPSAIDAEEFIKQNAALIGGPLYFWTHNTGIARSGSFYVYNPNDYVSYTLVGGIGTGSAAGGLTLPNGKISAGQAFFVASTDNGNFVFNNSMRNTTKVLPSGSNSQFFRMSQNKKTEEVEKNRVWLNLTNSDGIFRQLLVGYITGATNELDKLYDGISFDEKMDVDFYSVNNGKNLAIQGRALPFEEADQVPLGYKTTIKGTFTITIDKVDGVLTNQNIFIEDKITGSITNLKKGSYTFSTDKGVFNNRFVLQFLDNSVASRTSGKVASDKESNSALVSVKNKQIKINSFDKTIDKVMVYDLKTSLLYKNETVNDNEYIIPSFNSSGQQFLIVQILLKNGKWVTKEIVF